MIKSNRNQKMTLDSVKENIEVKIIEIEGGHQMKRQIEDIGIRKNDRVQILQNSKSGPIILMKNNLRVAIGRGMSKKITIEIVKEG